MSDLKIEYLANAGFLICGGGHKVLLDAVYSKRFLPFSAMRPEVLREILQGEGRFADVDLHLVTHCHPDHCSARDMLQLRSADATLIMPPDAYAEGEERPRQKLICPAADGAVWEDEALRITGIRTVHDRDGDIAEKRAHYSYLLEYKKLDRSILVMGDAATAPHLFDEWLKGKRPSAVIINFVEMNQEKGRAFLRELEPERALLCHMPLPEDDEFHIAKLARRSLDRYKNELPVCILCDQPGTVIELNEQEMSV